MDGDLANIMRAFASVDRTRGESMGDQPIGLKVTEMEAVYRVYGMADLMDVEEFVEWVIFLDNVVVEHYKKKKAVPKRKLILPP